MRSASTWERSDHLRAARHVVPEGFTWGHDLAPLLRRLVPRVYRIMRLTLGPRDDADGLARDIVAAAFQGASSATTPLALEKLVLSRTIETCMRIGRRVDAARPASSTREALQTAADLPVDLGAAPPSSRAPLLLWMIAALESG